MKNLKKLFAVLAAIMMVLTLGTTAVKAEEGDRTITINTKENQGTHTYDVYKVLEGTYKDGKLTAPKFAEGLDTKALIDGVNELIAAKNENLADDKKIAALADDASAPAVAEAIGKLEAGNDSETAKQLAKVAKAAGGKKVATNAPSPITVNGDGYYFVEDVTNPLSEKDSYSRYMLLNVGPEGKTVTIKADVVTSQKKVKEKNDTTGEESGWQDGADYDMGDHVPFQLKATLPANFDQYKTYSMWFCDEQSAGLQFEKTSVKVYVNGELLDASKYSIEENVKDGDKTLTFVVKIPELVYEGTNAANSKDVIVEYTSLLTGDAVVFGKPGNPNESYVKYSNNPNNDQQGEPKGTTPEDKVVVFTYEIIANKVGDDETTALEGAGFTLYKKTDGVTDNDGWVACGPEIKDVTTFEFKGTDAGQYKLVETTVPRGYNKAKDITFTVEAVYDTDSADPQLKELKVVDVDPANAVFTVDQTNLDDVSTTVVNRSGAELPETGGIGTTIFYTVGGLLVVGAIIMLIQKRRMAE